MSTVGYGDRVPTTKHGRALGVVWMLISFGLMTMLAGMFSSVLTVQHFNSLIRSPKDLKSVQCGAVEDSAAMLEGRNMGYPMTPYLTTEEALTALSTGEVGAVLGDTVRMRWVLEQPEWTQLVMLPTPIATLFNSFPMSEETHRKTMDAINIELLTIINSPEWEQMRRLYLGDHNE
jgi:polar amino acid transport system substrate-binding protein